MKSLRAHIARDRIPAGFTRFLVLKRRANSACGRARLSIARDEKGMEEAIAALNIEHLRKELAHETDMTRQALCLDA
jgi:hypothetical protein